MSKLLATWQMSCQINLPDRHHHIFTFSCTVILPATIHLQLPCHRTLRHGRDDGALKEGASTAPGLLLGTEAPVVTPNGIDFSFSFLSSQYLFDCMQSSQIKKRCSSSMVSHVILHAIHLPPFMKDACRKAWTQKTKS